MVRPITLTKPPLQSQKVDPKANAAQIARLEAQAAELREQIRLANRMGERDWATQARQELAQVNTQLSSLQPNPATAPATPGVVNAGNGTSGNGPTVAPALYVPSDLASTPVTLVDFDGSPPKNDPAAAATARNIVNDVTGGKSIDQIASARHMTREQVIGALRSGGMTVSTADPTSGNGDVQTTKITDADGRTVTQYYDYQHDSYYTSVQAQPNGAATTTPVRDGLGRKETNSYNPDTGAITTRYEDDLGTGTVTERTSLPNGASVETVTPGAGPSLPVTTVTGPDGSKTILKPSQDPGGASTQNIKNGLADGKSIDQIAKENDLTSQQVIAELQAAGYKVTTASSSDAQSVELVDPRSGDKTVYSYDYQHDVRTVTTTADGKKTSVSVDGKGTETKTVTDQDGRVTKTTTEKINGGEPVEYEVKPNDNLTLIAQHYGVTLDDLRRTNPGLFSSSRDPSTIHTGEKITIDNGTRTTVEVTFNGYTLTTKPDGSITLHNNTTGTDLKIEAGSTQEALARTLLAVNPNSSDPKAAKEGEVVKTFVEGLLAGETLPSLIDAAEKAGQDKQDLIDKYDLGTPAKPKLNGQNRVVDPFGDPPQGNAPSGGKWMPMKIDGVWRWVDPQVAQAIINENVALSRITETRALAGQRQEQFNVDLLDPAYKDAVDGAQTIINKALAPHGLQWTPQKPKGSLADAQARLTKANTLLQNAQDARGEYENAGRVLKDAIAGQGRLTPLGDPNAPSARARGTPDLDPKYDQGVADHSAVDKLFSEVGLHLSKGDKLTIDYLVGQAELAGVPADSKDYKDLKALQTTAGNQLELAQAYQDYFDAHADAAQVNARQTDLEQKLANEYLSKQNFNFDEKYNRINGDYLGHYQNSTLEIRDGQLWVVNHFDEGTTEQQLTYGLNDKHVRGEYRDRQLNKDWQALLAGYDSNAKMCTANGLQSVRSSEEQAAKSLNDELYRQLGDSLADLNAKLPTLQTNFDNALTHHKPGSVDAPEGTLPDGVQPVEINVGGQTIKVAPEVARNYNEHGIDALTQGGKAIWIDLDTKDDDPNGRWVDPELAVAKLRLEATRLQISQIQDLRRQLQGFNDYHELRLSEPSLLADDNTTVDKTYLDEHEQQTLDAIYQPRFQQLLDRGYDKEFHQQFGKDLDTTVAKTLGLDSSTDDGREAIENVTGEIRDIGGDNPYVRRVPIFYVDDQVGTQQVALFAVRDGDGNTRYVDATGKKFDDLGDFQDNNSQFSENGKLVVPKGLEMKAGADGKIALEVVKARNVSVWDKVVDPVVGIGTGIATILSFTPAAPVAAPLAYAGAAYLGTRAVINEVNHLDHGGEWDDTESMMNIASAATTVLPMASSGLRTIGMAAKSESFLAGVVASPRAFAGSIGATRSNWALAAETRTYMQSSAGLNKAAWGMDVGSVIVGSPLLATSAYDLAANGDQMNGLQFANALTGLGTGITGTGLGIHGLRTMRPGTGTQDPDAPGADANPPPGGDGPFQPPPGGKGPSQLALEPGPSGRPMDVYEIGADGVYRPTGKQVFHDPSHPVIPGEVIKTDDGSGNGSTAQPGRDPDGSTASSTPHPADGDPIVVPGKPTGKDGSVRLVWNPETRSFTGMPERDTSGYVYTSGKDPKTPSAYLDGLTAEQLVSRYEQEKSYYSNRELAERYGPDGVQIPRTPLRETLPDFRVGVTFRARLNTGQAFGIGSPTVAAVGFGVGTKTDFGMIGWSIVDSVSQRSLTPFKDALGTQGVVSYRAREYRNITALQAGVWPVSNQTALPVRSSDLSAAAGKAVFGDATGYGATPLDAAIVGMTPDGEGTVVEMTYTPSLKGEEAALASGQHDFFGVPAENSAGHVALQGTLPFDRVMTETKAGIRLPIVANHVTAVDQMPRIGFEKRPEQPVKDTLQPGDIVSKQVYDQIQSALGSTTLKIQFAVKDPAKASELVAAIGQGDGIRSIHDLVKSGQIDPSNTVSLVDEPTLSGFRLSAIPGKAPTADVVLLTGDKARVVNPEAMLVDVIFNDSNRLPGPLGFNPDRMVTSATYKVKSTLQSWLPARFQSDGAPQSRYMPSAGNIYKNLYGSDGTPATRYTVSFSTPPLPAGAVAYSAEVRFQYKTKAAKTAPSIAKGENATLAFDRANGQSETLTVPAWLAHAVESGRDGAATGIPKGGKASFDKFLSGLEQRAEPDQLAAIEQFKSDFGPSIVDGGFMRQNVADGVLTFLSSQARPPEAGGDGIRPAPRPAPRGQGFAPDGSKGPSSAKPLTPDEIAANRQEAASLLDDMLPQSLGMPEVTKTNLIDQISRSPTLMKLLRDAHAKDVRIVNPARNDLRISDAQSGDDLTATGSQYIGDVEVVFVDAETFRADDTDGDTVVAEFVDMLGHELSHVGDAPIDLHPADFSDRQAYRDAVVSAYLNVEGEAGFVQYAVADELATNGGKPAAILGADWNSAQADVFARYQAGEIDRTQAVDEMAALFGDKEPSTADGTYVDFYSRYADGVYNEYTSSGSGFTGETGRPAPANKAPNNGPLTRDGVRATPLDQVPGLPIGDFQPNQVPWLKREQVAELTEQQFRVMDQAGLLPYLTKTQLRGIPKAKTGYINIAGLDGKQVPWLTEGHIRNLTDPQFGDLGKAGFTRLLTRPQVQAIKGDKVGFVDVSKLDGRQVPWFKGGQVAKFTSPQFKDLGEAGLQKNLVEHQVRAIPETMIGSVDVAKFDARQVPWLTGRQIPALTRDQWGAFTIHHIEALTQPQIEAVTPKQFEEMSPGQFRKFTPEQFEWMSGEQTNGLSVLQVTTFRATHKKTMTPDQAASVDLALRHARMRENAQALATFGGMSTTSYVLWSSLPPTWSATAGAVAFGVRGFVFGTQAIFPNATANNKPFGRFLNALGGATFIAAAPGAATGMIQGKDLVVNSTFSLGNVVYGTKSMLQSFTGRPVIRNLAEHLAGPGYVLGCAVYTLHSWPAPIATVAGTMFTFGCAEFWASAIRTDRMNRRSVPRTDADIAAAAKSDKRWATADRWTLGITFGIGMLLFSLDSLLAQPWDPKTTPPPDPKKSDDDSSSQQPDDHSDVPGKPKTPPESFPQLVVSADDGLNLRSKPDGDSAVVTVLQPGTFVEQTAKPSTDPSGEAWMPVEGFGPDGEMHSGWVSADYVEVHPAGSSSSEGRTNPTLEKGGYRWVEVKNGDSIRLIANAHSADVADTVVLNMDHILRPDMIFSGDRIYLPLASVG
ncbi:LysM peptidoglycan-binding domain-containing protein [Mesorhizobium sp. M1D.F.Ca.ET.043.01.1.1]|uniref:LysM peptidoglycan-binding domain-containing protein n=1 Tax=Mesorhizobium sp. M1D.F.Ca.ET.043.01.1.1 TaxID=2493669 RepID=UPI000F754279|nr:LysM peptidoglycan-binding domain-containing protein [Mesorhizobium sp. M1D.F.Ca.ET.043.01.1.1]AZO71151.1 LysM peptidoglycan-binding domain-containing protein [Mesorhizobium sp. M1D.F.Ca.ET.043.01.1.1]